MPTDLDRQEAWLIREELDNLRGRVPILAVSADALELQRLAADGVFDAFIAKPFTVARLHQTVASLLPPASR